MEGKERQGKAGDKTLREKGSESEGESWWKRGGGKSVPDRPHLRHSRILLFRSTAPGFVFMFPRNGISGATQLHRSSPTSGVPDLSRSRFTYIVQGS